MSKIDENILKKSSKTFRVKEVTHFLGITPRILKHYETTGVLVPDRTQHNDYRAYAVEEVVKLQTAEQLKSIGLTSSEISAYFSGELDLNKLHDTMLAMRNKIDTLLEILRYDRAPQKPNFQIQQADTQLCYVKRFPVSTDLLQEYLDSRETYGCAITSGCRLSSDRMFFVLYEDSDREHYRVCLPILEPPARITGGGSVEKVTRKKSLVVKMACTAEEISSLRQMLFAELERRALKPAGGLWLMSEMGPNRKTALQLYTAIEGVFVE